MLPELHFNKLSYSTLGNARHAPGTWHVAAVAEAEAEAAGCGATAGAGKKFRLVHVGNRDYAISLIEDIQHSLYFQQIFRGFQRSILVFIIS